MSQIFVSYSRSDGVWVRQLVARLEHRGYTAWIDQRDIPVTLPWLAEVRDAILAADLFLMCDSPAARESASCSAEAGIAFEAAKRACTVEVSHDVLASERTVIAAIDALEPAYLLRTELAVLAQDWDRAGRPSSGLVTAKHRRRLARGAHVAPVPRVVERAFLRASRARTMRRAMITSMVALLAAGSFVASATLKAVRDKVTAGNTDEAAAFSREQSEMATIASLPYQGLAEAAGSGANESAVNAEVISTALRYPVPDDGFAVPAAAARFYPREVAGKVVVLDRAGHAWGRGAMLTTVRSATPAPRPPGAGPGSFAAPEGLSYRRSGSSSIVEVLRTDRLWRRIVYGHAPGVLRLSPDGRELAASTGGRVEIADLRFGAVRTIVRGVGPILDLMWSSDGGRLWALSAGTVASWPVRAGTALLDEPSKKFEAIFPGVARDVAWVVSHDGTLRELDIRSGRTLRTLVVPDEIYSAAGSPDGKVAALSGQRGEWIVPLAKTERAHLMRVAKCSLGRPAFRDAATFYLPCLSGELLTASVPARTVLAHVYLDRFGVDAVKVEPRTGVLLVGDTNGHLFELSQSGRPRMIWASACGASVTRIALAPGEAAVTTVGSGTGTVGCTGRGVKEGTTWHFDAVQDPDAPSILAESAAFSAGGDIFAYGFSDGTIISHSTRNILPTVSITTVDGAVRDMYVTPDDDLLVATDAGVVQRIHLCDACQNNHTLARVAAGQLARAVELHLAERGRR